MTFLLPSAQLRQAVACLDCATDTGVTLTADDVVRLRTHIEGIASQVERLERMATELVEETFDEAFQPFVRPPAPEGVPA